MNLGPHRFTLRQLQYAVAVADSLSFRKAAERCHVSQPSLSAQLASLEEALGVRLFERDRRGVLMTAAGRDLIERAIIGPDPFVLATPVGHPLGAKRSAVKTSELRATSLTTLAQMVAGGAGVTLLPQIAVATEAKRAELSIRPLSHPAPSRTIALVWRKRSPLGPALRKLATTAKAAYRRAR